MEKQKPIKLSFSMGFQIRYCLVIAAIFIAANILLYLLMNKTLSGSYLESLRTLYFLDQNLSFYLSIMALLQTCFVLILTLVITLLVSHRIAGPVFRYETVLSKIISGEFPSKVATRNTDQLKSVVVSLNNLGCKCRETFEKVQILSESLGSDFSASELADEKNREALRQKVADVRLSMAGIVPERSTD